MSALAAMPLVLLTPVYEDGEASSRLFRELGAQFGRSARLVVVDDGSVREPVLAANVAAGGLEGVVLRLRRNVGHQRAIAVGIGYVADHFPGSTVVVLDSDGEDMPSTVPELLRALSDPLVDIAVAERKSRVETLRFRLFYLVYKLIFGLMTGRKIAFGNFMALKPAAVKRLSVMPEVWTHLAGGVLGSRLRIRACQLHRGPRYAGKSKMNFVGLVLHGFRALMVFGEDVLVRVGLMSTMIGAGVVLAAIAAMVLKVIGYATPGWFSVALGVLFIVLLQTAALTLTTLMLSGVVKGGSLAIGAYREFIESIEQVTPDGASAEVAGRVSQDRASSC